MGRPRTVDCQARRSVGIRLATTEYERLATLSRITGRSMSFLARAAIYRLCSSAKEATDSVATLLRDAQMGVGSDTESRA